MQATEDRARHRAPAHVVAREADAAVGQHRARLRLGDVVQERAEAQRVAARHLVGERRASSVADRLRVLGAERLRRVALEGDGAVEHLEGVVEDVEVVVAALLDAAQRLELRQHARAQPELEREPDPLPRALAGEHPAQLGIDALARDPRERAGGRANARAGIGVRGEPQLAGQPHEAQRPQRVVLERAGR